MILIERLLFLVQGVEWRLFHHRECYYFSSHHDVEWSCFAFMPCQCMCACAYPLLRMCM